MATKSKTTGREKVGDFATSASGSIAASGPLAWPRLIQCPQRRQRGQVLGLRVGPQAVDDDVGAAAQRLHLGREAVSWT